MTSVVEALNERDWELSKGKEDYKNLFEAFEDCQKVLGDANKRVKELEKELKELTQEASSYTFYSVKQDFSEELNKFAIEKKIDGVQLVIDALASKGMLDTLTNFDINSVVEQLRKEQPSEQ